MAGIPKPKAIDVFEDNIADAERLVGLTRSLLNTRTRRMRRELREAMGDALKFPQKNWHDLDCIESNDVFVVLKPNGTVRREHFSETELRPLLRQAVVAISAAVESYVAEKASSYIGAALKDPSERLRGLALSFGDVMRIEEEYERRGWGYRAVIEKYLEAEASPDPAKIGIVFAVVGKRGFWANVDSRRGVPKGSSEQQLGELCKRRNRIAHTGDRVGRGRASLSLDEVETHFGNAKSIVEALEAVL